MKKTANDGKDLINLSSDSDVVKRVSPRAEIRPIDILSDSDLMKGYFRQLLYDSIGMTNAQLKEEILIYRKYAKKYDRDLANKGTFTLKRYKNEPEQRPNLRLKKVFPRKFEDHSEEAESIPGRVIDDRPLDSLSNADLVDVYLRLKQSNPKIREVEFGKRHPAEIAKIYKKYRGKTWYFYSRPGSHRTRTEKGIWKQSEELEIAPRSPDGLYGLKTRYEYKETKIYIPQIIWYMNEFKAINNEEFTLIKLWTERVEIKIEDRQLDSNNFELRITLCSQ